MKTWKSWAFIVCLAGLVGCGGTIPAGSQPVDAGSPVELGWPSPFDGGGNGTPNGTCPNCKTDRRGVGGTPFSPSQSDSESVSVDPQGALVVNRGSSQVNRYLWVADTALPGVVKVDMETLAIVGRYRTGGKSTSRTTVNALGEAFIGAREHGPDTKAGVTKILPHGKACPDRNGDGQVTTSTGPDDVLPYGQDECVVWHTETAGDNPGIGRPGHLRGFSARDLQGFQRHQGVRS